MNLRKKFWAQFTIITMLAIFVVYTLVSSFFTQISKVKQYEQEITTLNEEIKNTKAQIDYLKSIQGDALEGDLESVARKQLNMIKPNEIVFIDMSGEGN